MSPFDALSQIDKDLIQNWIRSHIPKENTSKEQAPLYYILRYWDAHKEYLFNIFGKRLIIEEPISIKADNEMITYKITEELSNFSSPIYIFRCKFYDFLNQSLDPVVKDNRYNLMDLMNPKALATNLNFNMFSYTVEKKSAKVQIKQGCKVMKVLGKLAQMFDIEGFEEFRIRHSQMFNDAKLYGTLCLSIHPLDFMTMSDNTHNWTTCMSWADGCYRQGTVEMMNSPYAVLAYVKSEKNMPMPGGGEWNNKKWREIFLVDKDVITEIKPYPFPLEELSIKILKILKSLAGESHYKNKLVSHTGRVTINPKYEVNFETAYMYNDFGCKDYHLAYPADKSNKFSLFSDTNWINYSGFSECMWCGDSIDEGCYEEEYESALICHDCTLGTYCEQCGRWTYTTKYISSDVDNEHPMCPDCYEIYTRIDPVDGKRYIERDFSTIYVIPDEVAANGKILDNDAYVTFNTVHRRNLNQYKYFTEDAIPFTIIHSTRQYYFIGTGYYDCPVYALKFSQVDDEFFYEISGNQTKDELIAEFQNKSSEEKEEI